MTTNTKGAKTLNQQLPDLVDWYILDRQISIEFSYNDKARGKVVPEYDVWYFQNGRRITERAIAMGMLVEFMARNYKYSLAQIMSALTARSWEFYISNFNPPEWVLAQNKPIKEVRKPGRPKKYIRVELPDPNVSIVT